MNSNFWILRLDPLTVTQLSPEPYNRVLETLPRLVFLRFPFGWENSFLWWTLVGWNLSPAWVTVWQLQDSVASLVGRLRIHVISFIGVASDTETKQ